MTRNVIICFLQNLAGTKKQSKHEEIHNIVQKKNDKLNGSISSSKVKTKLFLRKSR